MDAIRNFVTISDKIGSAGQPKKDQFELIADNGYRHVINLAMPDHPDSIANEAEIVTLLNMNYFHIPVPYDNPLPKHVWQFCHLMTMLDQDKTFVHCIMNYRVSAFLFHYFTKFLNHDECEAKSPMFERWQPEPVWAEMLKWSAEKIGLTDSNFRNH